MPKASLREPPKSRLDIRGQHSSQARRHTCTITKETLRLLKEHPLTIQHPDSHVSEDSGDDQHKTEAVSFNSKKLRDGRASALDRHRNLHSNYVSEDSAASGDESSKQSSLRRVKMSVSESRRKLIPLRAKSSGCNSEGQTVVNKHNVTHIKDVPLKCDEREGNKPSRPTNMDKSVENRKEDRTALSTGITESISFTDRLDKDKHRLDSVSQLRRKAHTSRSFNLTTEIRRISKNEPHPKILSARLGMSTVEIVTPDNSHSKSERPTSFQKSTIPPSYLEEHMPASRRALLANLVRPDGTSSETGSQATAPSENADNRQKCTDTSTSGNNHVDTKMAPPSAVKNNLSSTILRIQEQLRREMENDGNKGRSDHLPVQPQSLQRQPRKLPVYRKSIFRPSSRVRSPSSVVLTKREKPYRQWHRISSCVAADSRFIISSTPVSVKSPHLMNKIPAMPADMQEEVVMTDRKQNVELGVRSPTISKGQALHELPEPLTTNSTETVSSRDDGQNYALQEHEQPGPCSESEVPDLLSCEGQNEGLGCEISQVGNEAKDDKKETKENDVNLIDKKMNSPAMINDQSTATEASSICSHIEISFETGDKDIENMSLQGESSGGHASEEVAKNESKSQSPSPQASIRITSQWTTTQVTNRQNPFMSRENSHQQQPQMQLSAPHITVNDSTQHPPSQVKVVNPLNPVSGASQVTGPPSPDWNVRVYNLRWKKMVTLPARGPKLRTADRSRNPLVSSLPPADVKKCSGRVGTPPSSLPSTKRDTYRRSVSRNANGHSGSGRHESRVSTASGGSRVASSSRTARRQSESRSTQHICPQSTAASEVRTLDANKSNVFEVNLAKLPAPLSRTAKMFRSDVASKLLQKVNKGYKHQQTKKYVDVLATVDYQGSLPGQLSFRKGQVIKQRSFVDEPTDGMAYGFYRVGRLRKKKKGLFPAYCVTNNLEGGVQSHLKDSSQCGRKAEG